MSDEHTPVEQYPVPILEASHYVLTRNGNFIHFLAFCYEKWRRDLANRQEWLWIGKSRLAFFAEENV